MKINIFPLLLLSNFAMAANSNFDGKYNVFVWVAMVVLMGIFLYLTRLELKIRKIEKSIDHKDEA